MTGSRIKYSEHNHFGRACALCPKLELPDNMIKPLDTMIPNKFIATNNTFLFFFLAKVSNNLFVIVTRH